MDVELRIKFKVKDGMLHKEVQNFNDLLLNHIEQDLALEGTVKAVVVVDSWVYTTGD